MKIRDRFLIPGHRDGPVKPTLDILFIIGCTGCGKGSLGREMARRLDGEVVSVDSMKVYRRMDVGTAKPSPAQRAAIRHHLIDVIEPSEAFSAARFLELAEVAGQDIGRRGKRIIAVGGTVLYLRAWRDGLFEGPSANEELRTELLRRADREGGDALHAELQRVDPTTAQRIHPHNIRRVIRALEVYRLTGTPISLLQTQWEAGRTRHRCTVIGLRRSLEDQNVRTNGRVRRMIEEGLVEETQRLLDERPPLANTARQALGYAEIIEHLAGEVTLAEAVERIKINTRQFAKSQRTWFRRLSGVNWIDVGAEDTVEAVADRTAPLLR